MTDKAKCPQYDRYYVWVMGSPKMYAEAKPLSKTRGRQLWIRLTQDANETEGRGAKPAASKKKAVSVEAQRPTAKKRVQEKV